MIIYEFSSYRYFQLYLLFIFQYMNNNRNTVLCNQPSSLLTITKENILNTLPINDLNSLLDEYLNKKYSLMYPCVLYFKGDTLNLELSRKFLLFIKRIWYLSNYNPSGYALKSDNESSKQKLLNILHLENTHPLVNEQNIEDVVRILKNSINSGQWNLFSEEIRNLIEDDDLIVMNNPDDIGAIINIVLNYSCIDNYMDIMLDLCSYLFKKGLSRKDSSDFIFLMQILLGSEYDIMIEKLFHIELVKPFTYYKIYRDSREKLTSLKINNTQTNFRYVCNGNMHSQDEVEVFIFC